MKASIIKIFFSCLISLYTLSNLFQKSIILIYLTKVYFTVKSHKGRGKFTTSKYLDKQNNTLLQIVAWLLSIDCWKRNEDITCICVFPNRICYNSFRKIEWYWYVISNLIIKKLNYEKEKRVLLYDLTLTCIG